MKEYLKILFFGGLLVAMIALPSCNNDVKSEEKETNIAHHDDHEHVHDYACPMHPHLQGHKGEKCNDCGMTLEKIDAPMAVRHYQMDFHASSKEIQPGGSVNLFFQPRNLQDVNLAVPLDITHEKKMHLFIINEALSWFDHIHPVYLADGSYAVKETFPTPGTYMLFADYKPSGSAAQIERIDIEVAGDSDVTLSFKKPKTIGSSEEYLVSLLPEESDFYAQKEIHFNGKLTKEGSPFDANELQYFLGSKAHLVAVHVESKSLVHIHSEIENEKLHLHAEFPEPGMYRVWLQFKVNEQVHTIDFTLNAKSIIDGGVQGPDSSTRNN